jgi:Ricin-type beta-trefoil lectin domain
VAGRCLTDPGDRAAPGTRAEIAACGSGAAQRWAVGPRGAIRIRGRCLAVPGASRDPGTPVELARCGRPGARWLRGPDGELLNQNSGLCLADPRNAAAAGTKLVQRVCYLEPGELWLIS